MLEREGGERLFMSGTVPATGEVSYVLPKLCSHSEHLLSCHYSFVWKTNRTLASPRSLDLLLCFKGIFSLCLQVLEKV